MNEGAHETGALQCEVARLYEELAKANGACADMARELHGLVLMNEELEAKCTELQNKLELQTAKADNYRRQAVRLLAKPNWGPP